MSIEAHKCNVPGCKGYVVFENADFDFKDMPTDEKTGVYAFANPKCSECDKEFLVVPHYVVIDYGAEEIIDSACITAFERREKERKFEVETNPALRINLFLENRGYTYSAHEVIAEYSRYQETGCYLSHSMKDCISNLEDDIRALL